MLTRCKNHKRRGSQTNKWDFTFSSFVNVEKNEANEL